MESTLHTTVFEYDGIKFDVSFEFTPGYPATREEPGEDDLVEVTSICLQGSKVELPYGIFCEGFEQCVHDHCLAQVAIDADELAADIAADRFDALLTNDELMAYDR